MSPSSCYYPVLSDMEHLLARAAIGQREALEEILDSPNAIKAAGNHRLGPLLAHRMHELEMPVLPEFQSILRKVAITRLFIEEARKKLGKTLDTESIPWLPLKGMGSIPDYYPRPECRPTSDLDVLIPAARLDAARKALTADEWTPYEDDEFDPDAIYNWKAHDDQGVLLELHHTLWGGTDPALAGFLLQNAKKAPELGSSALRSPAPDLYIIGATHLWNAERPYDLLNFLDLHLLALAISSVTPGSDSNFATEVIRSAQTHDLQLFIGLAAAITNALWPHPIHQTIANALYQDLRLPERALLRLTKKQPSTNLHLAALTLARLLSRRKSQRGWATLPRYLKRALYSQRA